MLLFVFCSSFIVAWGGVTTSDGKDDDDDDELDWPTPWLVSLL